MNQADAIEAFLLGALWCGFGAVCHGYSIGRIKSIPFIALGASGGICGLMGFTSFENWNDNRKRISLIPPIPQIIHVINVNLLRPLGIPNIPEAFNSRELFYFLELFHFCSLSDKDSRDGE